MHGKTCKRVPVHMYTQMIKLPLCAVTLGFACCNQKTLQQQIPRFEKGVSVGRCLTRPFPCAPTVLARCLNVAACAAVHMDGQDGKAGGGRVGGKQTIVPMDPKQKPLYQERQEIEVGALAAQVLSICILCLHA
jgi:hypothetical protein